MVLNEQQKLLSHVFPSARNLMKYLETQDYSLVPSVYSNVEKKCSGSQPTIATTFEKRPIFLTVGIVKKYTKSELDYSLYSTRFVMKSVSVNI